jgi:hypothetical protein
MSEQKTAQSPIRKKVVIIIMNEEQLKEKIDVFKVNWKVDPVAFQDENTIIVKLFIVHREGSVFQDGKRSTTDTVTQRSDYFESVILNKNLLSIIEKYISTDSFTITKELKEFAELQGLQKKHLTFQEDIPTVCDKNNVVVIIHRNSTTILII